MALVQQKHCVTCGSSTYHVNGACSACSARAEAIRAIAWDVLPIEAKLADLRRRIEALERKPITY